MAYCDHCGAYIPDGQEICLACGFDPAAEKKRAEQASAQAAAYAYQAEEEAKREADTRAEAERRRAERKEQDRIWAENERRRRQMEEEFRRAQEEKERRAESYVNRGRGTDINIGDSIRIRRDESGNLSVNIGGDNADERSFDGGESREDPGFSVNIGGRRYTYGAGDAEERRAESARSRRESRSSNRGLAAISYLGVLFFVPLLFGSDDEFVRFHARQGLKLFAYSTLASVITGFVGATPLVVLLGIALSIKGIMNVVNGKMEELPLLNKLKWFS